MVSDYEMACRALALRRLIEEMPASDPKFDRTVDHLARELQRVIDDFIELDVKHAGTVAEYADADHPPVPHNVIDIRRNP
jgi:hypothetical protein